MLPFLDEHGDFLLKSAHKDLFDAFEKDFRSPQRKDCIKEIKIKWFLLKLLKFKPSCKIVKVILLSVLLLVAAVETPGSTMRSTRAFKSCLIFTGTVGGNTVIVKSG